MGLVEVICRVVIVFSLVACRADNSHSTGTRILPLGDSLTLGYGSATEGEGTESGYRLCLAGLLAKDGIDFDFVGSQSNGPEHLLDQDHEGHNGFGVAQVAEIAGDAILEFLPDVILLMAGTNDQLQEVPPYNPPDIAAQHMQDLLEEINTLLPGVQIVLAKVIPLVHNDEGIVEYNARLSVIVDSLSAQGLNLRLVDMYAIGLGALSEDGIHPTLSGYDAIADIWFPALLEAIQAL